MRPRGGNVQPCVATARLLRWALGFVLSWEAHRSRFTVRAVAPTPRQRLPDCCPIAAPQRGVIPCDHSDTADSAARIAGQCRSQCPPRAARRTHSHQLQKSHPWPARRRPSRNCPTRATTATPSTRASSTARSRRTRRMEIGRCPAASRRRARRRSRCASRCAARRVPRRGARRSWPTRRTCGARCCAGSGFARVLGLRSCERCAG